MWEILCTAEKAYAGKMFVDLLGEFKLTLEKRMMAAANLVISLPGSQIMLAAESRWLKYLKKFGNRGVPDTSSG